MRESLGQRASSRRASARGRRDPLHFRLHEDEGFRELKLGNLDLWIDQHYGVLPAPGGPGVTEHELLNEPAYLAVPAVDDRGPDLTAYRDELWADVVTMPEADLRFVTDDLEGILQFVASGVAVAVLPRLAIGWLPEGVTVHPLPGVHRRVIAFTRAASHLQPTFAVVLDELRRAGAALSTAVV